MAVLLETGVREVYRITFRGVPPNPYAFRRKLIDAPDAGAARRDVEEGEAVQHRGLAVVDDRPEAALRVDHEVGHRHLAAGDERGDTGEEPDEDQDSGDELDPSAHDHEGSVRFRAAKGAQDLLGAVTGEQQAEDDPEQRVTGFGETF